MSAASRGSRCLHLARCVGALGVILLTSQPLKADALLEEIIDFTGQILFIESRVPALVIGAVKDGETVVRGFGERAGDGSPPPDGETVMRIGSVTKSFTGEVLAHLVAKGTVQLTAPLVLLAPEFRSERNPMVGRIRLLDLATHAAGLPREVPREPGPATDPFKTVTRQAYADWLSKETTYFEPGSAVLYSNFGFDLLAIALSEAAHKPFPDLLQEHVTGPLGLKDTVYALNEDQKRRFMQGHGPDGSALPDVPTGDVIVGAGGLYSTPNDLLRWMEWHLRRFDEEGAEARTLDHALFLSRDGLKTVAGMDESGHMDAMALGWVAMEADGDRPFILQKAGGLQGMLVYIAFAPTRNVAVFVAINQFNFGAAIAMTEAANELIGNLAPR